MRVSPSIPEPPPNASGIIVPDELIKWLGGHDDLIELIRQRDAFGRAKYGQPLMSNDGRNGIEDARQELGDLLQYVMKCKLAGQDLTDFMKLVTVAVNIMHEISQGGLNE